MCTTIIQKSIRQKGALFMGMSASQARLLQLQSREADSDFAAQFVENMKTQLTRQQEKLSNDYVNIYAKEKQTIQNELDAIKDTINDNIDKSFNVFSDTPENEPKDTAVISNRAKELCASKAVVNTKKSIQLTNASPTVKRAFAAYAKQI